MAQEHDADTPSPTAIGSWADLDETFDIVACASYSKREISHFEHLSIVEVLLGSFDSIAARTAQEASGIVR